MSHFFQGRKTWQRKVHLPTSHPRWSKMVSDHWDACLRNAHHGNNLMVTNWTSLECGTLYYLHDSPHILFWKYLSTWQCISYLLLAVFYWGVMYMKYIHMKHISGSYCTCIPTTQINTENISTISESILLLFLVSYFSF